MSSVVRDIADSPRWLLQHIDVFKRQALLREMSAADYARSMFLDNRLTTTSSRQEIVSLSSLEDPSNEVLAAGWIFHIGHCGSTLLSRVLEAASGGLGLREPPAITVLSQLARDLEQPWSVLSTPDHATIESTVLASCTRRFDSSIATVIKPTSACINRAGAVLAWSPAQRVVLLTLPAESYLATMLRSDLRREEIRHFAQSRIVDYIANGGNQDIALHQLGAAETAAMSWASSQQWIDRWQREHPSRVKVVDFENLLQDPIDQLVAIAEHIGLEFPRADLVSNWSRITTGYGKDPSMSYSSAHRDNELQLARKNFAGDIADGLEWLDGAGSGAF